MCVCLSDGFRLICVCTQWELSTAISVHGGHACTHTHTTHTYTQRSTQAHARTQSHTRTRRRRRRQVVRRRNLFRPAIPSTKSRFWFYIYGCVRVMRAVRAVCSVLLSHTLQFRQSAVCTRTHTLNTKLTRTQTHTHTHTNSHSDGVDVLWSPPTRSEQDILTEREREISTHTTERVYNHVHARQVHSPCAQLQAPSSRVVIYT